MVTFNVSVRQPQAGGAPQSLHFSVPEAGVLLAGSRNREVAQESCRALIHGLGQAGFGFLVGCAPGVDRSFRKALSQSPYSDRTLVGCAFRSRVRSLSTYGLDACLVVPPGLSPKAALRRRTLWLVKRASLSILVPEDPTTGQWGKGSRLVYRAGLDQLKPVFVVCSAEPKDSEHYRVTRSCLYGVEGFWVVPHPISEGGSCDDEF
jgi:hypothetical protein